MALQADINVGANLKELRSELGKIPGITENEAKRMVHALAGRLKKAELASRATSAALKKDQDKAAKAAAKAWEQGLGDIKKGSEKVFGGIVGDVEDVAKGLLAAGGMAGPLAVGLFGAAAGAAAFAAGAAAVPAAGLAAAAAFVALNQEAEQWIKDVEHLTAAGVDGFGFTAENVQAIKNTNSALQGMQDLAKAVGVQVAGGLAPDLERGATLALAMGLAGVDAFEALSEGGVNVTRLLKTLIVGAFVPSRDSLIEIADAAVAVAKMFGREVPAGVEEFISANRSSITTLDEIDLAVGNVEYAFGDYIKEAQNLIKVEQDFAGRGEMLAAMEERRKAVESQVDLMRQQAALVRGTFADERSEVEQVVEKYGGLEDQLRALADQRVKAGENAAQVEQQTNEMLATLWANRADEFDAIQEAHLEAQAAAAEKDRAIFEAAEDAKVAKAKAAAAQIKAANEQMAQVVVGSFSSLSGSIGGIVDNVLGDVENMTEGQKKAAMAAFNIERAAALSQVGINTALAVSKILAIYPPGTPLTPLGLAATGLTLASGVAQAAEIATAKPPAFALGGVAPANQFSTDHVPAMVRPGQGLLTDEGMDGVGGEAGLARLNRGESGAGQVVVENRYKHRIFDAFVTDNIAKGGPLTSALNKPRSKGHRRRRG